MAGAPATAAPVTPQPAQPAAQQAPFPPTQESAGSPEDDLPF